GRGIDLVAGQTTRQTFVLTVGAVTETVQVDASAPLVSTAAAEQLQTFESLKVTELPLGRRNVTNVLRLSTGVDIGASRSLRINGVGSNGTGISVDGTDANAQPEQRGLGMYGGRNYIDVMSIDAVQEVQLVRGILPAEYGGVLGGQVNLISKSGTNKWHGSAFENYQSHVLNARNPFVSRLVPKPRAVFNQFGGVLGGPIKRDRIFLFGGYEGYRESVSTRQSGTYPTAALRQEVLRALPFQETRLVLDALPLPTIPRFLMQPDGSRIVDPDRGDFETLRIRQSSENHVIGKGDMRMGRSGNLSLSYSRMRPFGLDPRAEIGNDRTFNYKTDRGTASFTTGGARWTSESRFGYNENDMKRLDHFFLRKDPRNLPEVWPFGRSLPSMSTSGLFGTPGPEIWDMDGQTWTMDQKISRH
ncbi:MAG: TonB-dependent receptor plug domain-containing protein, partial [Gammaproteobacteria bacterium]